MCRSTTAVVVAGFWLENLTDVFITLAFPSAESFGATFVVIFVQRVLENMAYLFFQLDLWFKFRVWIKGKFKKDQVPPHPRTPRGCPACTSDEPRTPPFCVCMLSVRISVTSSLELPLSPSAGAGGLTICRNCLPIGQSAHRLQQQPQQRRPRSPNHLLRSTLCDALGPQTQGRRSEHSHCCSTCKSAAPGPNPPEQIICLRNDFVRLVSRKCTAQTHHCRAGRSDRGGPAGVRRRQGPQRPPPGLPPPPAPLHLTQALLSGAARNPELVLSWPPPSTACLGTPSTCAPRSYVRPPCLLALRVRCAWV